KIRHLGAKTISVEQFLKYLDTQPYKKPRPQPTSKPIQQQEAPPVALPLSEDFDHYLQIFEEKFRSLTGGDTKKEPIGQSEQDRWLELFEKRMNEENGA